MIRYVKLDMTHNGYQAALEECQAAFVMEFPGNVLGVNENKDKTMAWIKTTHQHGLEGNPVLLDESQDSKTVQTECSSMEWTGIKPQMFLKESMQ